MLEEISEKEFLRIILESEESILSQISQLRGQFESLIHTQEYSREYKNAGFNVKYLYDRKKGTITYKLEDREVGFKTSGAS